MDDWYSDHHCFLVGSESSYSSKYHNQTRIKVHESTVHSCFWICYSKNFISQLISSNSTCLMCFTKLLSFPYLTRPNHCSLIVLMLVFSGRYFYDAKLGTHSCFDGSDQQATTRRPQAQHRSDTSEVVVFGGLCIPLPSDPSFLFNYCWPPPCSHQQMLQFCWETRGKVSVFFFLLLVQNANGGICGLCRLWKLVIILPVVVMW